MDSAEVKIYSPQYHKTYFGFTDQKGKLAIGNLLASTYIITVSKLVPKKLIPADLPKNKDVLLNGVFETAIFKNETTTIDTIKLGKKILSGILINEIYYGGSNCQGNYKDDQFIELYNASDSTLFLDQFIIASASMRAEFKAEYAEARYVYQFPGNGTDYPMAPGEFVVIAQEAINHPTENCVISSVDLSQSDWEFFNKYGDDDNQFVSNLENINPNKKSDFLMSLIYDGVYLIDGKKITQLKHSPDGYVLFNFNDVIDGVQYSRDAENPKMFDEIIDAGFAGVGLQKYTGKSIERENPITGDAGYDTDNSSVDFVINNSPTPGFQHQKENNPPGSK